MPGKVAPIPCPDCGGPMWNNSDSKRSAKAPDYSCKDKQNCGKGVWLKDSEKNALQSSNGAQPGNARPPLVLDALMEKCLDRALELSKKFKDGTVEGADHDITLRMAQSLFIARVDGKGILKAEKEALAKLAAEAQAAKEKAERERREAEERAQATAGSGWHPAPAYDESDLPF